MTCKPLSKDSKQGIKCEPLIMECILMCKHAFSHLEREKKKTCAEDSEALLIMCSQFKNFKDNSRKTMYQNGTTIKYKILAKHSNNLASLQKQNKQLNTSGTIRSKKELTAQPTIHTNKPCRKFPQICQHAQSSEL